MSIKRKIAGIKRSLSIRVDNLSECLKKLIDEYGVAKTILRDSKKFGYHFNDFFYYCATKSCKSLIAVKHLIHNKLSEDALIIIRSMYECYLSISYVKKNPETIDDFVFKKVALHSGRLKHPTSKKGRINFRIVEDLSTGELFSYGITIGTLALNGKYFIDAVLHRELYQYLNEHAHVNMIAAGNYRNPIPYYNVFYSYQNDSGILNAMFFAVYVSILIITEIIEFESIEDSKVSSIRNEIKKSIINLKKAVNLEVFAGDKSVFLNNILKRLELTNS
jgi:hypothetical protein